MSAENLEFRRNRRTLGKVLLLSAPVLVAAALGVDTSSASVPLKPPKTPEATEVPEKEHDDIPTLFALSNEKSDNPNAKSLAINKDALLSKAFQVETNKGRSVFTVEDTEYQFGRTILFGKSEGGEQITLSVNAETGEIGATIVTTNSAMRIDPVSPDKSLLVTLPKADIIPDIVLHAPTPKAYEKTDITGNASTIDVMLPYTTAAREFFGSKNAVEDAIARNIAITNKAHKDSDSVLRYRLISCYEIDYKEPDNDTDTLDVLQKKGDGILDDVLQKAESLGADSILVIDAPKSPLEFCGIHYLLAKGHLGNTYFNDYSMGVVHTQCMADGSTIAHEFGHGAGMQHNHEVSVFDPDYNITPFAFGYHGNKVRDIMAYPDPARPGVPRVLQFSNPRKTYDGEPMGNHESDIATASRLSITTVANLREETIPFPDLTVSSPQGTVILRGPSPLFTAQGTYDEAHAPDMMLFSINFGTPEPLQYANGRWVLPLATVDAQRTYVTVFADMHNGTTFYIDPIHANKFIDIEALPSKKDVLQTTISVTTNNGLLVDYLIAPEAGTQKPTRLWAPKDGQLNINTLTRDTTFAANICTTDQTAQIHFKDEDEGTSLTDPRYCIPQTYTTIPLITK